MVAVGEAPAVVPEVKLQQEQEEKERIRGWSSSFLAVAVLSIWMDSLVVCCWEGRFCYCRLCLMCGSFVSSAVSDVVAVTVSSLFAVLLTVVAAMLVCVYVPLRLLLCLRLCFMGAKTGLGDGKMPNDFRPRVICRSKSDRSI